MLLWYCSYSKIGVCRIGKICLPMILGNIIISQALWWFRTINDTVRLKGAHRHQYNMIKRCSFIPLFRLWLTLQKEVAFWTRQAAFTPIRLFWPEIHLTNSLGILGQLLVTINKSYYSQFTGAVLLHCYFKKFNDIIITSPYARVGNKTKKSILGLLTRPILLFHYLIFDYICGYFHTCNYFYS